MKIHVKDLSPDRPRRVVKEEHVEFSDESMALKGPVVFDLEISLAGEGILVQGEAEGVFVVHCHRCWKPFDLFRSVKIDEVFILGEEPPLPQEQELYRKDFNLYIGPHGQIDVTELVFQSLFLSLPSKVLCSEDCRGGETHSQKLKRSPFEVLKGLKQ